MRLSFQMEACLPGTIPDPPLLAAALDLVSWVIQIITGHQSLRNYHLPLLKEISSGIV